MLGFPKYYGGDKVKELLEKVYGEEKILSCSIGGIYGSRKPYSDIDLFVVSEDIIDYKNEWINIFTQTKREFEEQLKLFAVSLRDPLLHGELIFGDRSYFGLKKQQWLAQPITENAIRYNIQRHKELKEIAKTYPLGHKKRRLTESYSASYLQNALKLKRGIRI